MWLNPALSKFAPPPTKCSNPPQSLYAWGDTWTSSRLVNAMDAGSLVVFTNKKQLAESALVFAHRVPWDQFVVFPPKLPYPLLKGDREAVADVLARDVLALSEAARAAKRQE